VKELCEDKLATAKISFLLAAQSKPFLKKFHAPLVFMMKLAVTLTKSIIEKTDGVAELLKIDVTHKDTRCNYKEVDVGVAADTELAQAKLSDA